MRTVPVLTAIIACLWLIIPSTVAAEERVLAFSSYITVHEDASLTVRETIKVRVRQIAIKRGVVREFPTTYETKSGSKVSVGFEVLSVERDGKSEPYHIKKSNDGVRVYMGRSGRLLTSDDYTYVLTYRTTWQVGFFEDHDELYWNVTGNGWRLPIDKVEAVVELPAGASITSHAAYTGRYGESGKYFSVDADIDNSLRFRTTKKLDKGEGLTIVAAWPKGFVHEPSMASRVGRILYDNLASVITLVGALLVVAYYLVAWHLAGRDPDLGTVIPLFTPPRGLSPAGARFVSRMGFDEKVFTAAIINLAVKGALTIEDANGTFTLRRCGKVEGLSRGERKLLAKLFKGDDEGEELVLAPINNSEIRSANDSLEAVLTAEFGHTHFVDNVTYVWVGVVLTIMVLVGIIWAGGMFAKFLFVAVITLLGASFCVKSLPVISRSRFGGIFAGGKSLPVRLVSIFSLTSLLPILVVLYIIFGEVLFGMPTPQLVGFVSIIAANVLFYFLMKAPTKAGARLLNKIEGFKQYLSVAEVERLGALHPPDMTPKIFEQYLPYALALDVDHEWSEKFSQHLTDSGLPPDDYAPNWYSGTNNWSPGSGASGLMDTLGGSLSEAISMSSTPPGENSGLGGGGFSSGGGFSGGGGGGGGGGGW